jgi:hypothetical protein
MYKKCLQRNWKSLISSSNETINVVKTMPNTFQNTKSFHSFEVVMSGGTWAKVRGLKVRQPFIQQVVQQASNVQLQ